MAGGAVSASSTKRNSEIIPGDSILPSRPKLDGHTEGPGIKDINDGASIPANDTLIGEYNRVILPAAAAALEKEFGFTGAIERGVISTIYSSHKTYSLVINEGLLKEVASLPPETDITGQLEIAMSNALIHEQQNAEDFSGISEQLNRFINADDRLKSQIARMLGIKNVDAPISLNHSIYIGLSERIDNFTETAAALSHLSNDEREAYNIKAADHYVAADHQAGAAARWARENASYHGKPPALPFSENRLIERLQQIEKSENALASLDLLGAADENGLRDLDPSVRLAIRKKDIKKLRALLRAKLDEKRTTDPWGVILSQLEESGLIHQDDYKDIFLQPGDSINLNEEEADRLITVVIKKTEQYLLLQSTFDLFTPWRGTKNKPKVIALARQTLALLAALKANSKPITTWTKEEWDAFRKEAAEVLSAEDVLSRDVRSPDLSSESYGLQIQNESQWPPGLIVLRRRRRRSRNRKRSRAYFRSTQKRNGRRHPRARKN